LRHALHAVMFGHGTDGPAMTIAAKRKEHPLSMERDRLREILPKLAEACRSEG
jgi:hypothetical protein